MNEVYNVDCMEAMKQIPDKYFDLAVVDPPYGDANARGGEADSVGGLTDIRNMGEGFVRNYAPRGGKAFQEQVEHGQVNTVKKS